MNVPIEHRNSYIILCSCVYKFTEGEQVSAVSYRFLFQDCPLNSSIYLINSLFYPGSVWFRSMFIAKFQAYVAIYMLPSNVQLGLNQWSATYTIQRALLSSIWLNRTNSEQQMLHELLEKDALSFIEPPFFSTK